MTRYTSETLTPRLRWLVDRDGPPGPPRLQQYWSITTYDENRVAIGTRGEWRDVPNAVTEPIPEGHA